MKVVILKNNSQFERINKAIQFFNRKNNRNVQVQQIGNDIKIVYGK